MRWLRPCCSSHAAPDPRGQRSSPCQRRAGWGVRMDPPGGVPGPSASAGRSGRAGNRPAPGRVCGSHDGGSLSERWDGAGWGWMGQGKDRRESWRKEILAGGEGQLPRAGQG